MLPVGVARSASRASALLLLLLLIACGGGDGDSDGGARPTISPTRTPTATLPSPELPSPTRSPDRTESPDAPAAQPSSEPPAQETASERSTPSAAETEETPDTPAEDPVTEPSEDEGAPTWVWWLLGALVAAAVLAIPLVMRARRRKAWRNKLAKEEGEIAWFTRELLSGFRQASREQVAGGWAVGEARVAAAEDRLTVLESTAPDADGRQRARSLRDAVRHGRDAMARLTGPEPSDTWALDLDAIIADLEVALRPSPASSPE